MVQVLSKTDMIPVLQLMKLIAYPHHLAVAAAFARKLDGRVAAAAHLTEVRQQLPPPAPRPHRIPAGHSICSTVLPLWCHCGGDSLKKTAQMCDFPLQV